MPASQFCFCDADSSLSTLTSTSAEVFFHKERPIMREAYLKGLGLSEIGERRPLSSWRPEQQLADDSENDIDLKSQ